MRLHLVDGTYELFRAYFSKRPPHRAPDGSDKKATVVLASSMLALLHDEGEAVTHVAVAFDNPIRSFRNDLFDGYKTEEGVPPELLAQFDAAEEAVRPAPRLAATLEERKEEAKLYRTLATLRTDAPVGTLEEARFQGVPRERFLAWCDALGVDGLRVRPQRWQ